MTSQYVNESTSIIQLDAFNTPPGWSTIVFVSSSKVGGHMVTIRDQTGFISTPKRFLVSSTRDIFLSTGISTLEFNQPFSYISLVSLTSTLWTYVNLPPLYGLGSTPTVDGIQAPRITTGQLLAGDLVSMGAVYTTYTSITSSLSGLQAAAVSSLTVNASSPVQGLTVQGSATLDGSLTVGSNLSVGGPTINISGPTFVGSGGISSLGGSLTIGSIQSIGAISATDGATFVGGNVNTGAIFLTDGPVTTLNVRASTIRAVSASTVQLYTSSAILTTSLAVGTHTFVPSGDTLILNAPLQAPSTTVSDSLRVAVSISTPSLTLRSFGSCSTLSSFTTSSLQILNASGSLEISSIQTGPLTTSSLVAGVTATASVIASTLTFSDQAATSTESVTLIDGTVSTIPIQYKIAGGFLFSTVEKSLTASLLNATSIIASSFATPSFTVNNFQTSTLGIRNSLTFTGSTVDIQRATLLNGLGSISSATVATSSITVTSNVTAPLLQSAGHISFPNTAIRTTRCTISTHSTVAYVVENLSTSQLLLGTAPTATGGPAILQTDIEVQGINAASALTSTPRLALAYYPYQYRYGTGQGPLSPTLLHATTNYQQYWSLTSNDVTRRTYLNARIATQTSAYSGLNTIRARVNDYSTIFTFTPAAGSDSYVLSNADITDIPFGAVNPVLSNLTPYVEFRGDLNGKVVADVTSWISYSTVQADATVQAAAWNSNEGIEFRNGSLRFPNQILGTTIYNAQNDTATRNLTYTGSIYTPSDSTLKDNIEAAALAPCLQQIEALPLRRFRYIEPYASTFQIQNYDRLGLLTTDVGPLFTGSVTTKPFPHCGLSTVNVIQDEAIQFSHLGATQALLQEVSSLRTALSRRIKEA